MAESNDDILLQATRQAVYSMTAWTSGNWAEYWTEQAEKTKARLDEYYRQAKEAAQQDEPVDMPGAGQSEGSSN